MPLISSHNSQIQLFLSCLAITPFVWVLHFPRAGDVLSPYLQLSALPGFPQSWAGEISTAHLWHSRILLGPISVLAPLLLVESSSSLA